MGDTQGEIWKIDRERDRERERQRERQRERKREREREKEREREREAQNCQKVRGRAEVKGACWSGRKDSLKSSHKDHRAPPHA